MFCPKCSELELEPVTNDKLEYLACVTGCEGVWIEHSVLEKYWGKKRFKQQESLLITVKQRHFEEKDTHKDTHKEDAHGKSKSKSSISEEKGKVKLESFDGDEEDEEPENFDDEDEDNEKPIKNSKYKKATKREKYEEVEEEFEDDEDEDEEEEEEEEEEEVEEVIFGNKRDLDRTLISEDGDFEGPVTENNETYVETPDMMEEEDNEPLAVEQDENLLWTSPVSGNLMKRFNYVVNERLKCSVGNCSESDSYWIDGSEEVLLFEEERKQGGPKSFSGLLAFDRPEEEIIEEDEDEDDI
jgi:Zn-finger nucleic acid-binding protein